MNKDYLFIKNNLKNVIESMSMNYIYYIILLTCVSIISLYTNNQDNLVMNLMEGMFTIYVCMIFGYYAHLYSHRLLFENIMIDILKETNKFIKKDISKIIPNFILSGVLVFCKILDYHHIYHHDSVINKKWYHIIIEFTLNIITEGVLLILLNLIFKINYLNNYIIFFWGLLYATVHIINYNIKHSIHHEYHHIDTSKNYGVDTIDILLGSKYKEKNYENLNMISINILLITPIIILLKKYKIYDKIYDNIYI